MTLSPTDFWPQPDKQEDDMTDCPINICRVNKLPSLSWAIVDRRSLHHPPGRLGEYRYSIHSEFDNRAAAERAADELNNSTRHDPYCDGDEYRVVQTSELVA
jgi:hypothetical protein